MNTLILDVECTFSNKGNPFDLTNKLVCIGFKTGDTTEIIHFPLTHDDYSRAQAYIDTSDLLVGFNIKFDLHWLRRVGINFTGKRVWDCQIGEFLLNNQLTPYPSLDAAAGKYGFAKKLDIVKTEYWEKGIDTDEVPKDILSDYLAQDLELTEQVYLAQRGQFSTIDSGKFNLFRLQCADLLVLQDIEYSGILFNTERAKQKAEEIQEELDEITKELSNYTNGVPINPNSNDHISCLLYGGIVAIDDRIPVGVYKTGAKVGHTRYKIVTKHYELPRLVEPLKGTEAAKEGYWKVNYDVLRSLKLSGKGKKIVELLNRYSELEKLRGTYLIGYSELIEKMNWEPNMIHGTLNQCVVVTGRLSSSRPNLQNCDSVTKLYMESRYGDSTS